ncbi:MAG: archease [Gemmataceae bacterium]|nr:archease [Gemmataceae bacterium]
MYELFEHTADLGLRAAAPTLDGLFVEMAAALLAAMVENPESVRPETAATIEIAGADREYLLFDWLKELLYRFDADHMLYSRYEARVGPDGLSATVHGEPIDPARHLLNHEVKAITYHGLKVEQMPDGWQAEVIVDI